MTKEKYISLIKPIRNRNSVDYIKSGSIWHMALAADTYEAIFFTYTIREKQSWREAQYIYGIVLSILLFM